jgi:Spy/CpxP family protein refolding chaperone
MRQATRGAAVLVILTAACLTAQPHVSRAHDDQTWAERRTQFLVSRLNLTDAQKQQVLALYTSADQNSGALEDKLSQARRALRDATRRNAPYTEIDQLASTVGVLFGQLEAIQAKADTAVYNSLTAEQRQKLERGYGGRRGPPHFPARKSP